MPQFYHQKDIFDESLKQLQTIRLLNKEFNEHAIHFVQSFTEYNDRDALKEALRLRYQVHDLCSIPRRLSPTVTLNMMDLQKNGGRRELEAQIREVSSALRRMKERSLSSQDRIELSDSDDEVHIVHDSTTTQANHSSGKQVAHKGNDENDDDSLDDEKIRRLHFQRKPDASRNKTRAFSSSSSSARTAANMDPTVVAELKAYMDEDEFRKVMEAQMNPDFLSTGRSSLRFNRPTPSKKGGTSRGGRQETMEDYVSRNQPPFNSRGNESPEVMFSDEDMEFDDAAAAKRSDRRSSKRILASSSSSVDFIDDRAIEDDDSDDASWHDADEKRKSPSRRKSKRKRKAPAENSPKDAPSSSAKKGRSKSPNLPLPSPVVVAPPPKRMNARSIAPSDAVLPSSRFDQFPVDAIDIDDSDGEVNQPLQPNEAVISQIRQYMQQTRGNSRRSSGTSAHVESHTHVPLPAVDEAHVSDISHESDNDDDDDEELTQPQQMVDAQFEMVRKESHEKYQRKKEQELAAAAAATPVAAATAAPQPQRSRGNSVAEAGYWNEESTGTPARGSSNERPRRSHSNADESMASTLSVPAGASNADAIDLT